MMNAPPENWVKQVEALALQAQEIPMWGAFPGFPWAEFAHQFAKTFQLETFDIKGSMASWRKGSSILEGMGDYPLQLSAIFSPLQGSVSLIFPLEDFIKFSSWIIDLEAKKGGFEDPFLQRGFLRYLGLEGLRLIDEMHILQTLTPKLVDMPLSQEDAYCIDISLEKGEEIAWARLVCPPLFHRAFKEHYASTWQLSTASSLYGQIFLTLSLSAGHTSLAQKEWKGLREGDFVILDYASYFPRSKRGTFQLLLDRTPLFQLKLKEENMKILDYALYYEERQMNDQDEDFDTSFDKTDPTEMGEKQEETREEETHAASSQESAQETLISANQVPIRLTVEVASLKMSLETLLTLKPGNVLDLSLSPSCEVYLVANGKHFAKGHLVQIGEVVGVKITKIGPS